MYCICTVLEETKRDKHWIDSGKIVIKFEEKETKVGRIKYY